MKLLAIFFIETSYRVAKAADPLLVPLERSASRKYKGKDASHPNTFLQMHQVVNADGSIDAAFDHAADLVEHVKTGRLIRYMNAKDFISIEAELDHAAHHVEQVKTNWLKRYGGSADVSDSVVSTRLEEGKTLVTPGHHSICGRGNSLISQRPTARLTRVLNDLSKRLLHGSATSEVMDCLGEVIDLVADELTCEDSSAFIYKMPKVMTGLILGLHALGRDNVSQAAAIVGKCLSASYRLSQCPSCLNTDWIYTTSTQLVGYLAILGHDAAGSLMELRAAFQHHLEPHWDTEKVDGLKYDGAGYHHWTFYPGYMYAYRRLADALSLLGATMYQVDPVHLQNLRDHAILQQVLANPDVISNSLCGRHPLRPPKTIDLSNVKSLMEVVTPDPFLDSIIVGGAALDGFWQANYGSLSVLRSSNNATCASGFDCSWVVTFKGMTSELWGSEIYKTANRYGRYQSHGAVELSLPEDNDARDKKGWDWNHPPGTTTVKLPFASLLPKGSRMDVFATNDFAGALRVGLANWGDVAQKRVLVQKHRGMLGIFAFHLAGAIGTFGNGALKGDLSFKKSCTAFMDAVYCAGSDIQATSDAHVVTTLSQETGTVADVAASDFPQSGCKFLKPGWFESGRAIKYYTWNYVKLCREVLDSPKQSGAEGHHMSGTSLLAYIDHGLGANSSNDYAYAFLVGDHAQQKLPDGTAYLHRDTNSHILRRLGYKGFTVHSYVFFASTASTYGPVRSSSAASLVTTLHSSAHPDRLQLSVVVPTGVNSDKEYAVSLEFWCTVELLAEENVGKGQETELVGERLTIHAKFGEPVDMVIKLSEQCISGCTLPSWWCTKFVQAEIAMEDILSISFQEQEWTYKGVGTGVGFGRFSDSCNSSLHYCAGVRDTNGPDKFGWSASQVAALKEAMKTMGGVHPEAPGTCDWNWRCANLKKAGIPLRVAQRIRLFEGSWTLDGKSTCVAYGNHGKMCDESKFFCPTGKTHGNTDEQVAAVIVALMSRDGVHPSCPQPCTLIPSCSNKCSVGASFCNLLYQSGLSTNDVIHVTKVEGQWAFKGLKSGVGAGSFADDCNNEQFYCAGMADSIGAGKFGHSSSQINALKVAMQQPGGMHPQVPGECTKTWPCAELIKQGIPTAVAQRVTYSGSWALDGQDTCVASGTSGTTCDTSKYACTDGNKHGSTAAQVSAVKRALSFPNLIHPQCPEFAQQFLV